MLSDELIKALVNEPVADEPNRLRRFMGAANVTQPQLEEATGISQPQISAITNGRYRKLNIEVARKLAEFFGCAIEDLFPSRQAVAS